MTPRFITACLPLSALLAAAGPASGQVIIHRYVFNGTPNDSVGTANGTLVNATISGGQLVLNNGAGVASNTPTGKYATLPPTAFPTGPGGLTSFSIESFYNWVGLMLALRNQQISDFPLNNKSFNLSYCGHDL